MSDTSIIPGFDNLSDQQKLELLDSILEQSPGGQAEPSPELNSGLGGDAVDMFQRGALQGVGGLLSLADEFTGYGAGGAKYFQEQADQQLETLSPQGQEALGKEVFTRDENGNLVVGEGMNPRTVAMLIAQGGGTLAPSLIGGGGAGLLARATGAGRIAGAASTAGFGVTGGGMAQGMAGEEARNAVMQLPDDKLYQSQSFLDLWQSDFYDPSLSEKDNVDRVRAELADEAASQVMRDPELAAVNFGSNLVMGKVFDGLFSGVMGKSRLMNMGIGGATEAGEEFVQEGASALKVNEALRDIDPATADDNVLPQALTGAIAGFGTGAPLGAMSPVNKAREDVAAAGGDALEQELAASDAWAEAVAADRRDPGQINTGADISGENQPLFDDAMAPLGGEAWRNVPPGQRAEVEGEAEPASAITDTGLDADIEVMRRVGDKEGVDLLQRIKKTRERAQTAKAAGRESMAQRLYENADLLYQELLGDPEYSEWAREGEFIRAEQANQEDAQRSGQTYQGALAPEPLGVGQGPYVGRDDNHKLARNPEPEETEAPFQRMKAVDDQNRRAEANRAALMGEFAAPNPARIDERLQREALNQQQDAEGNAVRADDRDTPLLDHVREQGIDDDRLAFPEYRNRLLNMASQLEKGQNRNTITDDEGYVVGRAPSTNPDWYKGRTDLGGVDDVKAAVEKALRGEKLGARQARAVSALMDAIEDESANYGRTGRDEWESLFDSAAFEKANDPDDPAGLDGWIPAPDGAYLFDEGTNAPLRTIAVLWDEALDRGISQADLEAIDARTDTTEQLAREIHDAIQGNTQAQLGRDNGRGREDQAQASGDAQGPRAQASEAGSGSAEQGSDQEVSGGGLLSSYTEAELQARAEAERAATEAEAKRQRDEEAKAQADAEAGDFRLSGSDQPADIAAAGGQADLLGAGSRSDSTKSEPPAGSDNQSEQGAFKPLTTKQALDRALIRNADEIDEYNQLAEQYGIGADKHGANIVALRNAQGVSAPKQDIRGEKIDDEWTAFSDDSGTLKIPRANMPQVKAEHRGALANFLKARGIKGTESTEPADNFKPTQAEFSPAKVEKAKAFTGGDRAILVSRDNHVVDGHHQWLAKRDQGEDIKVIRLDGDIRDLLELVKQFPSAKVDRGADGAGKSDSDNGNAEFADLLRKRYGYTGLPPELFDYVANDSAIEGESYQYDASHLPVEMQGALRLFSHANVGEVGGERLIVSFRTELPKELQEKIGLRPYGESRDDIEAQLTPDQYRKLKRENKLFRELSKKLDQPDPSSGLALSVLRGWLDAQSGRPEDRRYVTKRTPDMWSRGFNPIDGYRSGYETYTDGEPLKVRVIRVDSESTSKPTAGPNSNSGQEQSAATLTKTGKPFKSEKIALATAKRDGVDNPKAVPVDGGWGYVSGDLTSPRQSEDKPAHYGAVGSFAEAESVLLGKPPGSWVYDKPTGDLLKSTGQSVSVLYVTPRGRLTSGGYADSDAEAFDLAENFAKKFDGLDLPKLSQITTTKSSDENSRSTESRSDLGAYPLDKVAKAYSGTSNNPKGAAKLHKERFESAIDNLRSKASAAAETDAQREALEAELDSFKKEYLEREAAVISAREATVSSHIAGRNNFNKKQADRRGSALDKAGAKFDRWLDNQSNRVLDAVLAARTPEQVARAQAKAKDKGQQAALGDALKEVLDAATAISIHKLSPSAFRPKAVKGMAKALDVDREEALRLLAVMDEKLTDEGGFAGIFGQRSLFYRQYQDAIKADAGDQVDADAQSPAATDSASHAKAEAGSITVPESGYDYDYHRAVLRHVIDSGAAAGVDEVKAAFEALAADPDAVKKALSKLTIKQLTPIARPNFSGEKKARLVDMAFREMVTDYEWLTVHEGVMTRTGGYDDQSRIDTARERLKGLTAEDLQKYADKVNEATEKRKAAIQAHHKALTNPETLEELETFVRHKGREELSPEQLKQYDALKAGKTIEEMEADKAARAVTDGLDTEDELEINPIKEGVHGKTGEVIFNVSLVTRLGKEKFKEAAQMARSMGGGYWRGNFYFKTREDAELFTGWLQGDAIDNSAKLAEREAGKQDRRVIKLREMAERLEEQGKEKLSADRKTNTARRARMASSAEDSAAKQIEFARILRLIAEAVEAGKAPFLANLSATTQLSELRSIQRQAIPKELRNDPNYDGYSVSGGELKPGVTIDDYAHLIDYPRYQMHGEVLADMGRAIASIKGLKRIGERLQRRGDADPRERITLSADDVAAIKAKVGTKYTNRFGRVDTFAMPWQLERQAEQIGRLQRMGINTGEHLRAAIRELDGIDSRVERVEKDPIKDKERELVGKKIPGFFPTPETVVQRLIDEADIAPGMKVLEPSAGKGDIADAVKEQHGDVELDVVEYNATLRDLLEVKGYTVAGQDFLNHSGEYDRIVMNPPFEKDADIQHVRHAFSLLKPGGKLVAIMSGPAGQRQNAINREFGEWLDKHDALREPLPEGSFKSSFRPTGVSTQMVVIEKPAIVHSRTAKRVSTKPKGVGLGAARIAIAKFLKQYKGADDVTIKVFRTYEEAHGEPAPFRTKGGYDPGSDTLFIYTGSLDSIEDLNETLRHEILVHKGLGMVEPAKLKQLLSSLREAAKDSPRLQGYFDEVERVEAGRSDALKAEELLARIAQERLSLPDKVWNRIVLALQRVLASVGLGAVDAYRQGRDYVYRIGDAFADGKRARRRDTDAMFNDSTSPSVDARDAAFKRWFGESKVVDGSGEPLVMYHGTPNTFTGFDKGTINGRYPYSIGFHFSTNPNEANAYTREGINVREYRTIDGSNVMPVYLKAENPLVIETSHSAASMEADLHRDRIREELAEAERAGNPYDSVIIKKIHDDPADAEYDHWNVIVFEPTQVKSAVGNNGDFDANNPDIAFSRSAQKSNKANIRRGKSSLAKALTEKTSVHRAMFRNGLGWIDFVWGDEGRKPSPSGRRRGAKGLSHIIEARQRKDGMTEREAISFVGRLVETIANGEEISRTEINGSTRVGIDDGSNIAWLVKNAGSNGWLVTGYEKHPDGGRGGRAPTAPTHKAASLTRGSVGAGDSMVDQDGSGGQTFYSRTAELSSGREAVLSKIGMAPDRRSPIQKVKDALRDWWREVSESFIPAVADKFHDLKKINAEAYMRARMSTNTGAALAAALGHATPEWHEDGILQAKRGSKGLLDILKPIEGDVNEWVGWMVGKRAERLAAEDRENLLTEADIAELLDVSPEQAARFQQVADEWREYNGAMLDLMAGGGLITQESADHFKQDPYYIPFYREVVDETGEVDVAAPFTKRGLSHQKDGIEALKGGASNLQDPLKNMLMNVTRAIDASVKNNALRRIVDEVDVGAEGAVLSVAHEGNRSGNNVIRVRRDGENEYYRVHDLGVLGALTAMNDMQANTLTRALGIPKRLLTAGVTATPTFMLRNAIRDITASWMQSEDVKWQADKAMGQFADALKLDDDTIDMMMAGSAFMGGYRYSNDATSNAQALREQLRAKGMGTAEIDGYMSSLFDGSKRAWEWYREKGERFENMSRLKLFKDARESGLSYVESAYRAKDLMDFSLHGRAQIMHFLIQTVPFMNARIQGLYKLGRVGANQKNMAELSQMVAFKGAMLAAATLALYALNEDDDDYQALPDWDKDANWHIFLEGEHLRIPKPFELGLLFSTIPERAARLATGDDDARAFFKSVGTNVIETLSMNPMPQALMPAVEGALNYDVFRGRAIDNQSDMGNLPGSRKSVYTSELAKGIGGLLEEAGYTGDMASPKRIDHIIKGYTGSMGISLLSATDAVIHMLQGTTMPAMNQRDYPVLGWFARGDDPAQTRYGDEFYRLMGRANQAYRTIRDENTDDERRSEIASEYQPELRARRMLSSASKRLSKLRKQRDAIYLDDSISSTEKRERLNNIQALMNEIQRRSVDRVESLRE